MIFRNTPHRLLLTGFIVANAAPALANTCTISGQAPQSTVLAADNQTYTLLPEAYLNITNCHPLTVQSGSICVISQGNCQPLSPGQTDPDSGQETASNGVFSQIAAILGGISGSGTAGSPLFDSTAPLPGFPYGTVLLPANNQLVIPLRGTASAAANFQLRQDGTAVPGGAITGGNLVIDTSQMIPDQNYDWAVPVQGQPYTGTFHLADQDETNAEMAQLNTSIPPGADGGSAGARNVLRALQLNNDGYPTDAFILLAK